jgi:soluble lytic murein transglycosylase
MRAIEMQARPIALMLSVFIFFLLAVNFFFLNIVNYNLGGMEEKALETQSRMLSVSEKLNAEKEKMTFASQVLDVRDILSTFNRAKGGLNTMDLAYLIVSESRKHSIDPYLVLAVIKTESSFNRHSVSSQGAMGLMQLLPGTARYISDQKPDVNIRRADELFDPVTNIKLGVGYLAYLMNKYENQKHAIIAYNLGPGNLRKKLKSGSGLPQFYYSKVMKNYRLMLSLSSKA